MTRRTSSVWPWCEKAIATSSAVTMPRSPWTASAGLRKNAGVPVEASVAATLRAMWPALPMPVTTTRPLQASISSMARSNRSSSTAVRLATAAASSSIDPLAAG